MKSIIILNTNNIKEFLKMYHQLKAKNMLQNEENILPSYDECKGIK